MTTTPKEIRTADVADFDIQYRDAADGGKMTIEGYAAIYGQPARIGRDEA